MKKYNNPIIEITHMTATDVITLSLGESAYSGFGSENEGWDWSADTAIYEAVPTQFD